MGGEGGTGGEGGREVREDRKFKVIFGDDIVDHE